MSTTTPGSSRRSKKKDPSDNNCSTDMPNWAKDLEGLWSNEDPNLEAEIRYNTKVSLISPYCAICSLFAQASDGKPDPKCAKKPRFSKPLISDKMFSSNAGRLSSAGFTPAIDVEGRSPLVTCVSCAVCVHASCYGLQYDEEYSQWKCSKCSQKQCTASCWLCHLRGGALKRTTTGHWCHIVCALAVPEVAFESVVHRSPISVTRVPTGRMKMKCEFCYAWTGTGGSSATGVCIQCCDGVCTTAFHVSCAQAYGIKFSPAEWPFPVDVICHKHPDNKENSKKKIAKESFPVAKLSPRKSVSAGPRSSMHLPVRRSGSTASVPDVTEQNNEIVNGKASLSNASKTPGKLAAAADKSKHPIVCLKFLSDTEVKRLSSPSSSPMAKTKEEEETPKSEESKSLIVRRKMGPLSKVLGKKKQSTEITQFQTVASKSDVVEVPQEIAATSSSSLPGLSPSTPGSSAVASPRSNSKNANTGKNILTSPERKSKPKIKKASPGTNVAGQEKKVSLTSKSDRSQENSKVSLLDNQTENVAKKAPINTSPPSKDNHVKNKKSAQTCKDPGASQVLKEPDTSSCNNVSKVPDAAKPKNAAKKSKMSPKLGKTGNSPSKIDSQNAKKMTSPKRQKKLLPKLSPVKTSLKFDSGEPVKSSPKSNSASPVKQTAKAKSSDSPANNVINHNYTCDMSSVSGSTPMARDAVLDSRMGTLLSENSLIPLSATLPLACSTPVQDISDCSKEQQSPVTGRSRSGRAIKISSVAREAFMDTTEENNFGFLMGCQSGEASPDPTKPKSFSVSEEPKEPDGPQAAKKLHWKTLQKMERLRLEQEGDDPKGTPLYIPKTTLPKLPHNNEHIQAIIDLVVENARKSVDAEEDWKTGPSSRCVKETSSGTHVTQDKSASGSKTDKTTPRRAQHVAHSAVVKLNDKLNEEVVARENGFTVPARSASPIDISANADSGCSGEAKTGLNGKLTDLIAKMSTRVKELPQEEVPQSSSSTETTPNASFMSASSSLKRTDDNSSDSEEDSSDSEDDSASASSPEKSVCSRSRSPRFNAVDDTASASAQDFDWFRGEVQIDGLGDDNNNEAVSKVEENLEELESSRDSFDYVNSMSNAANVDSAEEPELHAEMALSKVQENNKILCRTENPKNDETKKNAFFSAELESYLLNVSPVKQGEFLGSKSTKGKVEFKKGTNGGWKNNMEPDIDEVEGVIFFSFSCKEALEKHVKKEKSSAGIPRQVSSSLAKYHAKIQQDAAVSGMGLYPRGSCKSLVKHMTYTQLENLGLDLPRHACRHPDFSRESEWRQVDRGTYDTMEDNFSDVVDNAAINDLTSSDENSSFDVNVTRIYGRKSDGTFARKKMALPRLKRLGPAQPVSTEEPPGLDKYESQSKEWGIVTTQIIQQRARELRQEGFTFPRKKPLVSYQPVTLTSSMALAAATALQLVPTMPREPSDTACKRPGCRYGCVCHLCESVPSVDDEDEANLSDHNSTQSHNCPKQYCRLGCICDSIDESASSPTHCGKPSCMFDCICNQRATEDIPQIKEEKDTDDLEPGEVRIVKEADGEEVKFTIGPIPVEERIDRTKFPAMENSPAVPSRGRGRGMGRGRGLGKGRGGIRGGIRGGMRGSGIRGGSIRGGGIRGSGIRGGLKGGNRGGIRGGIRGGMRGGMKKPKPDPKVDPPPPAEASGSDDATVRKSSRLKNKPLIGIGNIDRLNSLVFFDTVAWLADGDGPRKRKKMKEAESNAVADHQGSESLRRLSTGSKGRERIGSNSSNAEKFRQMIQQQMGEAEAIEEGSDDAMETSAVDGDTPSSCARAYVYLPKKRKRRQSSERSIKSIKSETKDELSDGSIPKESPQPKPIKIKSEKISPIAKNLSPAAKQMSEGAGDYVHPLMGKFKTQMVLLQRKRTEPSNLEAMSQETPYLLEIQSNCDWEGIRSQLLSKISTEMNMISANAQYEYPNLTSFKIGSFIADILPRPEKATTIPPNLQRILKTKDMYPIRIRIIHSSCQLSPVGKQLDSQLPESSPLSKLSPVPAKKTKSNIVETKVDKKKSTKSKEQSDNIELKNDSKKKEWDENRSTVGLSGFSNLNLRIGVTAGPSFTKSEEQSGHFKNDVKRKSGKSEKGGEAAKNCDKKRRNSSTKSEDSSKEMSDNSSFVGLSGLSRLNLKIDGYSGPAGPSMALLNLSSLNNFDFHLAAMPRHPHRTPTPPGMLDTRGPDHQNSADQRQSDDVGSKPGSGNSKEGRQQKKTENNEKVEAIPLGQVMFIPVTSNLNNAVMNMVSGGDASLANLQSNLTNAINMSISSGSSKLQALLSSPPMSTNQADIVPTGASAESESLPVHVNESSTTSNEDKAKDTAKSSSSSQSDNKLLADASDSDSKTMENDQTKPADQLKYVPAGFLVVPNPAGVSQGTVGMAVKALVFGPQHVVASTRLPVGTDLKSLPASFRLTPVMKNINIPLKCVDGKNLIPKCSVVVTDANDNSACPKSTKEKSVSPSATLKAPEKGAPNAASDNGLNFLNAIDATTATNKPDGDKDVAVQPADNADVKVCKDEKKSIKEQVSKSQTAVPITINCSIQSGSVKFTEGGGPDEVVLGGNRQLTPELDRSDDDMLSIDDDESDSVDVEAGDEENILLTLRKQHVTASLASKMKPRPERRSSSPRSERRKSLDKDLKKKGSSSRELSTHCSRLESGPTATTTTEKKALERRRRFQICRLFNRLQKVYEGMCNVRVSTGVPVPKFRLLQFAITTISMLEEKEKKLKEVRSAEVKRRIGLVRNIRELCKDAGRPMSLQSGVPEIVRPFRHETWFENRAKKAAKEEEREKEEERQNQEKPAAFHFRPIEEVVSETPTASMTNSNNTKQGHAKKSRKRSTDVTEKPQSSFKKNIPKITQADRAGNGQSEVYEEHDLDHSYGNDLGSAERQDLSSNQGGSGDPVPNLNANNLGTDKTTKTVTENLIALNENSKETLTNVGESQASDQTLSVRKRKISRSDGDSPSAKESKL